MIRLSTLLFITLFALPVSAETLTVSQQGESFDIELRPARNVFADGYRELSAQAGELVETPQEGWANRSTCRYLVGDGAAFRQCEGDWEGVYRDASGLWDLTEDLQLVRAERQGSCGVAGADSPIVVPPVTSNSSPTTALQRPSFFEVTVVTDPRLATLESSGFRVPDPAMSYFAAAVLFDGTPFEERVLPILTGVVNYDQSAPWGSPTSEPVRSGGYLDDFNAWLETRPAQVLNRDAVILLSGWDFEGSTVGLANVSGACDLGLNGALVYGEGPLASVAQTLAHELGHTIGMDHDAFNNSCPQEGFVMQAVYSEDGPYPTDFSSCSVTSGNAFLASGAGACIDEQSVPAFPEPRCGDGLVEGNEACDCGPDGCAGRNPCCDEATCQLATGALCAGTDGCCNLETCAPRAASENFVCRESRGTCDVAEVCTGGAACPDDRVEPPGDTCSDGTWNGTCYLGECVTRGGQCDAVFDLYFFDTPPYSEMCGGAEAGCRVLECVANRACVLTEEVPYDGTECGNGSQCINGSCQASATLPAPECLTETDVDGDGVDACGDDADLCPTDANKTAPGFCGCLRPETCPEAEMNGGGDAGGNPSGNNNSPADSGNGGDEEVVVLGTTGGTSGGCSSAGSPGATPAALLLFLLGFMRRRKLKSQ